MKNYNPTKEDGKLCTHVLPMLKIYYTNINREINIKHKRGH